MPVKFRTRIAIRSLFYELSRLEIEVALDFYTLFSVIFFLLCANNKLDFIVSNYYFCVIINKIKLLWNLLIITLNVSLANDMNFFCVRIDTYQGKVDIVYMKSHTKNDYHWNILESIIQTLKQQSTLGNSFVSSHPAGNWVDIALNQTKHYRLFSLAIVSIFTKKNSSYIITFNLIR